MATSLGKVYGAFTSTITSYSLAKLSEADMREVLMDYLEKVIALEFTKCKKNLQDIDYVNQEFKEDLSLQEINIIAYGMVLHWIRCIKLDEDNLKQKLGDRDYKKYSEANFLEKLELVERDTQKNLRSYLRRYSWSNVEGLG